MVEAVPEGGAVSPVRGCLAMDGWELRAAYEEFRVQFAREYEELGRECAGLAVVEKQLGEYES